MDKLEKVFREVLNLDASFDVKSAQYQKVQTWDSVAHMALIAGIEEAFDLMIETDDVIDMSSFSKACEIVAKYGVSLSNA